MISTAVQKGDWVYVYDEKGNTKFSKEGKLHGYTSNTVSIQWGDWIRTYDENQHTISSIQAR